MKQGKAKQAAQALRSVCNFCIAPQMLDHMHEMRRAELDRRFFDGLQIVDGARRCLGGVVGASHNVFVLKRSAVVVIRSKRGSTQ